MVRFWAKVERTAGCWLWTASVSTNGYGQAWDSARRTPRRAHRLAWEDRFGPVPEGFYLDHLCRVRRCVNPDHLQIVTNRINVVERGDGPTARNAAKTHCLRGHPFDEANTRRYATRYGPARACRACHRERWHQRRTS